MEHTALNAAMRLEDSTGQAVTSRLLAGAYMRRENYGRALSYYETSADLCRQLGNHLGEAKAWHGIALIAAREGRCTESLSYFESTRQLYQTLGHTVGEVNILIATTPVLARLGDLSQARERCREAMALALETDNQHAKASAWHATAFAENLFGNFTEATACFQSALDYARKSGDRFQEADVLAHLGDVHHATGSLSRARDAWSQALAIFGAIEHPDADRIRAKLATPGQPTSRFWCAQTRYALEMKRQTSDTIELRRPSEH